MMDMYSEPTFSKYDWPSIHPMKIVTMTAFGLFNAIMPQKNLSYWQNDAMPTVNSMGGSYKLTTRYLLAQQATYGTHNPAN
jgi:hypothetical protein